MALFDPQSLPPNFDDLQKTQQAIDLYEQLVKSGDFYWFIERGDGGYTIQIYWDEEPPPDIARHMKLQQAIPCFNIRGDRLFFSALSRREREKCVPLAASRSIGG